MNTKDTDILNIILIVISLAMAFYVPYGLLLFSYAFLGPLHYLTEINWLKEKNYFVKESKWIWLFAILGGIFTIPFILKLDVLATFSKLPEVKKVLTILNECFDEVFMISLLFAIGLIYFKERTKLILFLIGSAVFSIAILNYFTDFAMFIAVFIPTLIHVFLFTLFFMIYGTIKSKTTPGIIAIVLLLMVPVIITLSKINPLEYNNMSDYTLTSYNQSTFGILNLQIAKLFTTADMNAFNFMSATGIKIQIFVAFAYTYHYLNWFSKTSIIHWNKNLSRSKIIAIISIWVVSVAIYLYNFKVGFIVLTFLSLLHVFFEFPLNITSMREIIIKIKSQFVKA